MNDKDLKNILNKSLAPIFVIERDGFSFVTKSFADIFGYSTEEILSSKDARRLLSGEGSHLFWENVRKCLNGELEKAVCRIKGCGKDGFQIPLIVQGSRVDLNRAPSFIGSLVDITECDRAIKDLALSEGKYKDVFNNVQVGIYRTRISDGLLLDANQRLAEIWGFEKPEDMINKEKTADYYVDPGTRERMLAELLSIGQVQNFEARMRRKNGEIFWILFSTRLNRKQGYMEGVVTDITELKKSQEALIKAKEKAEEATKLKDKFVSLVSHDLRAPFTSIIGGLRLLNEEFLGPLNEQQKKAVGLAIRGGEELLNMTDKLLDITRISTGKIVPHGGYFSLRSLINIVKESYDPIAKEKEINIINDVRKNFKVFADYDLLKEVFMNLVNNAIKFSKRGGEITIFSPEEEPNAIAVKDAGVGIQDGMIPDLFKHEVKTTSRGTSGERGSGLGLPLCADIIKAHDGKMTVKSVQGEGTIFYIYLPSVKPIILVVDFPEEERKMARDCLKTIGAEVLEAENGDQAMSLLEKNSPHLIITDMEMLDNAGFSFIEFVKKQRKHGEIPVIVTSSEDNAEMRERAFQSGANDFILKPISHEEFIPRVHRFIG